MHSPRSKDSGQSTLQLWRQIQTIIKTGNEQAFEGLCDKDRAPLVARVLLNQRLVNDSIGSNNNNNPKRRILPPPILPQQPFHRIFGTSVRDLNGLQLCLFLRQESMGMILLDFLHGITTKNELGRFMNHPWGQQNTSLHLAAYLGMDRLVHRLLEYGADPTLLNARQQSPLDGCTNLACIQQLQSITSTPRTTTTTTTTTTMTMTMTMTMMMMNQQKKDVGDLARTSMLLKKAVQRIGPVEQLINDYRHHTLHRSSTSINKPCLVFSSSTSSSSYSSLSSLEDPPLTPTPRPFFHQISHDHAMYQQESSVINEKEKEHDDTPQDDLYKSTRPFTKKSVRFSPETILLDTCRNGGDLDEFMRLMTTTLKKPLDEWEHPLNPHHHHHQKVPSSLLHLALIHRQEEIAKALISLGANVNATDHEGWTPLHYAATLKLWSSVDLLAQHPDILIHAKTNTGLLVYECPRLWVDQRKCRSLIERASRRRSLGT